MTTPPHTILIVEDEIIIATKISLFLKQLGYIVHGIISRGEEVLAHCRANKPDIVLLDIRLKGTYTGIDTALELKKNGFEIPIIYLTANFDDASFSKAKETNPFAFISKPFKKIDLQRAIELTISKLSGGITNESAQISSLLKDRVFVKQNDRMIKLMLEDILYAEADRSYCRVKTKDKEHILSMPLKDFSDKISNQFLVRVHRSYLVNISNIDEVAKKHVILQEKMIPISRSYYEEFIRKFQLI